MSEPAVSPFLAQARELHRRIPVVMPYLEYYGYDSLFAERGGAQCDLEKLDAAGISACGIALANGGVSYFQVGPNKYEVAGPPEWALERTRASFGAALQEIQRCPRVRVIRTARDLDAATTFGAAEKRVIGVIPLITGHSYLVDLKALDDFFALGLRISHCSLSTCTRWCRAYDGAIVRRRRAPVFNDFGRAMVARMNELGIVIDAAHMSDESTEAIIAASSKPVTDGHTSSRDLVPFSRGHSDRTLRKIADSGGVAGVNFADHMLTKKVWECKYTAGIRRPSFKPRLWKFNRHLLATVSDPDERVRLRKDREAQEAFYREHKLPPDPVAPASGERLATVEDMAEHVVHMVKVMGIEHVGLGGDVNGIGADQWPLGMDHLGELPRLTAELLRRGWREADLEKFLSLNWHRVYRECLPV